jgi:hypothetical protein
VGDAAHGAAVHFEVMFLEQFGKLFRLLDADGAHQDRLAPAMAGLDLGDDRLVLLRGGPIDLVVVVDPHHRPVGRDLGHVHLVDVEELLRLGGRRAGHAGQLLVEAEVVLDRHRGEGLVLGWTTRFPWPRSPGAGLPKGAGRASSGR